MISITDSESITLTWTKQEIEEELNVSITDRQFITFLHELNDPSGTFQDMALAMFDVVLEEILATDACSLPLASNHV
jgi:predicted NUDIX family phosphoesterase